MKQLLQGCSRSPIAVTPKNWATKKASIKSKWRIYYRFYDPAFKEDRKKWGLMVCIRGMNQYTTLEERQEATRILLNNELELLDDRGYNPVRKIFMNEESQTNAHEVGPETRFIPALEWAMRKLQAIPETKIDIKSVIKYTERAARNLFDQKAGCHYNALPISMITRKHIVYILDYCEKYNQRWSNLRFNKYKAYLSMLFKMLIGIEAIEMNPTRDIPERKVLIRKKQILDPTEKEKIHVLRERNYNFWRYIHIFFHSGSRTTEMLNLRKEDVKLLRQEFKVIVRKGQQLREDIRPINNAVLPLWEEIIAAASPGQYLFSRGLAPGDSKIRKDQICRRWDRWVVKGLGIKKSFYSLKHSHTDAIAEKFDIHHAAISNGHTTPVITMRHYAVGEQARVREALKSADVRF
jgi:integrase